MQVIVLTNPKKMQETKIWVLAYGEGKTVTNTGSISIFDSFNEAWKYVFEKNADRDLLYSPTTDREQVETYCLAYNLDLKTYL